MVVLEALARGVPVVGSDLGGMPELIEPGETGDLVAAERSALRSPQRCVPTSATRASGLRCATERVRRSSRSSRRSGISTGSTPCTPRRRERCDGASGMKPARIAFIGQRGVPATIGGIEHHVEEIGIAAGRSGTRRDCLHEGQLHGDARHRAPRHARALHPDRAHQASGGPRPQRAVHCGQRCSRARSARTSCISTRSDPRCSRRCRER